MILCHLLNRGVDKRKIFIDKKDYFRFIHNLFVFNDTQNTDPNNTRFFNNSQLMDIGCPSIGNEKPTRPVKKKRERELIVKIHAFCLMPNHYHLLVSPVKKSGIPLFMKKTNMGYSKYFNEKYKRVGALFQGKYKAIAVDSEPYFSYIPYYIHFNPLDLMPKNRLWRERKMNDPKKALAFLEKYRWSSHLDYLGKKNFPSVTQRGMLLDLFGGEKEYKKSVLQILKEFSVTNIQNSLLE